ncbi:helix-turn-helix domain-containing protein [Corynebacterium cystitidis]|uniref:helix-turn-helix domain-containing protein n=1 Tax=Corynebacterium cystitidis TaxID=35757 RepID=UPI00211E0DDE|nr:helix-turn-helix domain-containing protein [Corynebacterium cystitidis]
MAKLELDPTLRLGVDLASSDIDLLNHLTALRKCKNMTQESVARKMGVDRSVIARLESTTGDHSKNHTMESIRRYAEAIGAFIGHVVFDTSIQTEREEAEKFKAIARESLRERRMKGDGHERLSDKASQKVKKSTVHFEEQFGPVSHKRGYYAQATQAKGVMVVGQDLVDVTRGR